MPSQPTRCRIVLVTGSSQGLGRALCREFHANGFRVFATARDVASIEGLRSEGIDVLPLDVTDLASISHAARILSIKTGGRLDILVNNAAVCRLSPSITQDPADLFKTVKTNLLGPILVAQAFVPIIFGSNSNKGGLIINIGSGEGVAPTPWLGMYGACKSGLNTLSSTWRMELRNLGVNVMHVVPGSIATAMLNALVAPGVNENLESARILYRNWKAVDKHRQNVMQLLSCSTPDETAKEIVEAVRKPNPPRTLYCGVSAWLLWILPFIPAPLLEWIIGWTFGAYLVLCRAR